MEELIPLKQISTSLLERLNGTIRQHVAPLHRKTRSFAKCRTALDTHQRIANPQPFNYFKNPVGSTPMNQIASLMIVSDHQLFRECLNSVLADKDGFTVIASFANTKDLLDKVKSIPPDILLIDISLANGEALDLIDQFKTDFPRVKIIVFGLTESTSDILQFIEIGATGFIMKQAPLEDLVFAIHSVYRGEVVCPPRIAYDMFSQFAGLSRRNRQVQMLNSENLTQREMTILWLIADGLTNKQIAKKLCLSVHTVKNHVHNILEKLNVRSRSEAINYAKSKGLLKSKLLYWTGTSANSDEV
jgi:DNA-binding NarL/FixJ family response regulator